MIEATEERIKALIPKLEGWNSVEKSLAMGNLVLDQKATIIVELGVFGGRSLIPVAMALRDAGQGGRIYGIDPWQIAAGVEGEPPGEGLQWWLTQCPLNDIHTGCMKAIWDEALEPWVVIMRCRAEQAAHLFAPGSIDILYIDSNHSEFCSCRDTNLYLPLVKPGGHIWFDDIDWPSTERARGLLDKACTQVKDVEQCRLYQKPQLRSEPIIVEEPEKPKDDALQKRIAKYRKIRKETLCQT